MLNIFYSFILCWIWHKFAGTLAQIGAVGTATTGVTVPDKHYESEQRFSPGTVIRVSSIFI